MLPSWVLRMRNEEHELKGPSSFIYIRKKTIFISFKPPLCMYVCMYVFSVIYSQSESESCSVISNSLRLHGLYSLWNSAGQNTGVGSLSLLQGIFPMQGLNPSLPHCRQILYQGSHKGSQRILEWVAYPFFRGSFPRRNQTGVSCIAGRFFTNWAIREAHIQPNLTLNNSDLMENISSRFVIPYWTDTVHLHLNLGIEKATYQCIIFSLH